MDNIVATRNITINNTGNYNSTLSGASIANNGRINVTAHSLIGQTTTDYNISAANFSVRIINQTNDIPCNSDFRMENGTTKNITNSSLGPGNRSVGGEGKAWLFVCLFDAPADLPSQTYTATGNNAWVITVGNRP